MAVRNEVVRLSLDDDYTTKMAKVAAVTALANSELHSLDGSSARAGRSLRSAEGDVDSFGSTTRQSGADIDKYSGRLRLVADAALTLGPALIPLGTAAVAGVAGLTAEIGALAGGIGVGILALHGIGDAMKALDAYHLDPTAENLAKVRQQLDKLGPSGTNFVEFLDAIEPRLRTLQMAARNGLFPGLEQGIGDSLTELPQVRSLVRDLSTGLGDLAAEGGAAIKGGQLDEFFNYLRTDAAPTLEQTVRTMANLAGGIAHLIVAAAPLSRTFSAGLLEDSRSFEHWAAGLAQTQGYADFVSYVEETGPQAAATLGAIANSFLQVLEAASPLGGPVLRVLEAVANVVGEIADSDLGTPIFAGLAALSLYNRALAVTVKMSESAAAGQRGLGATIGGNLKAQADGVRALPGAYRAAAAAQQALTAAEVEYRDAAISYNASLRLRNRLMTEGYLTGHVAVGSETRLADSLGRVEMATYSVQTATERVNAAEAERSRLIRGTSAEAGKAAALVGGLALATSGAADGIGLTNTASLALIGTMAGPWGTAIGAGIGLLEDAAAANDTLDDSFTRLQASMPNFNSSTQDLASFNTQLEQGQQAIDAFAARMDAVEQSKNPFNQFLHPADQLAGLKNYVEGVFGNSDVQDAQLQLNRYGEILSIIQLARDLSGKTARAQAQDFSQLAIAADTYTNSLEANIQAMRDERAEQLKGINAHLDYRSSLLDAADALKENGKTVDQNTRAGEANLHALYAMPAAWNAQSDAAKNAKGSLSAARRAFVDTATAMGMPIQQAEKLARRLYEIPTKVETRVTANTSDADLKVQALNRELNSIDRNIDIYTRLHITRLPSASGFGPQAASTSSTGSTVPKDGRPYADRYLYMLAPGEEIISNEHGQADRFRPLLKAINARMLAGGGTAGIPTYVQRRSNDPTAGGGHQMWVLGDAAGAAADGLHGLRGEAAKLKDELSKAKESFSNARQTLDQLKSDKASYASTVSGQFLHDAFGNGLAGLDAQVSADTNDAAAMTAVLKDLVKHGLDPRSALFRDLAGSGDLNTAQQLDALTTSQLRSEQTAYGTRGNVAGQLGAFAGDSQYGQAIARQSKVTDHLADVVHELAHEVKQIGKRVHDGAQTGAHTGTTAASERLASAVEKGARAGTAKSEHTRTTRVRSMVRTGS